MPWSMKMAGLPARRSAVCATLAALALAVTCGCGGSREPAGRVSGKVTSVAGPVTEANVQFVRADGVPIAVTEVDASGQFTFDSPIAVGDYRVAVLPIAEEVSAEDADPRRHQEVIKRVPQKYWDSHTSGLVATVKEGDNSFAFTLQ
jgi:hypothetical protein